MTPSPPLNDSVCDGPLDRVIAAYLDALQAGQAPDREELLRRHPQWARELQSFFADHDRVQALAGQVLAPVTPSGAAAPPSGGTPVQRWGEFELLEEVARGGMGVVYKARDLRLNRLVALKRILAGAWASPASVQRFRREAEDAAQLDHPHIVPIYEVGEHEGQPYFSMKYFEGGNLGQHADRFGRDPRAAARLLANVARAVHHAHQRGILHRDLKPANILLDGAGQPHVTDFGLAKRLAEATALTQSGVLLGTPCYMPPEQAAARKGLTTAADVYSLGAILYELLGGRPPFRAATALETVRQVLEQDPVRLRSLRPHVDRDLETICLKCLQKEPGGRYGSAAELADDLERFLDGRPIAARPVGVVRQAGRWCRRHPGMAALIAAVLVSLAAGAGVASYFAVSAADEAQQARQQRDKARERYRLARHAIDQFHRRVGESPEMKARGVEQLRTRLLEDAAAFYERLGPEDQESEDPEPNGRALVYLRLGEMYQLTGRSDRAEEAYREALALFETLAEAHPRVAEYRGSVSTALTDLGLLYQATGRAAEAAAAFAKALDCRRQAVAGLPHTPRQELGLVLGCRYLANVLRDTGKVAQAEETYQEAVTLGTALAAQAPEPPEYRLALASCHVERGILYRRAGKYERAEEAYSEALAILQPLAAAHPDSPDPQASLAAAYHSLGALYDATGRIDAAERVYREALAIGKRLTAAHPEVPSFATALANSYCEMGTVMRLRKQPQAALEWYDQALQALDAVLARDTRHAQAKKALRCVRWGRSRALVRLGRFAEAVADADRALEMDDGQYRDRLRAHRALVRAYAGDRDAALAEANELAAGAGPAAALLYDLARVHAALSSAAGNYPRLAPDRREQAVTQGAARALELLGRARTAGYFRHSAQVDRMRDDPDLEPLRPRAEFQKLLDELGRAPPAAGHDEQRGEVPP